MNKSLSVAPLLFLLTACGAPSVEDLIEDPEKLEKISQQCMVLMIQGKDTNTEECNNANEAKAQMVKNLMKGLLGQFGPGQKH